MILVLLLIGFVVAALVPQQSDPPVDMANHGAGSSSVAPANSGLQRAFPATNEPAENPATRPKVELGRILTSAGQRMPSSVLGLGAYALGVLVPALAAAVLLIAIRPRGTTQHLVHRGGVALAVLVALLPVTGLDDRFVGWLVQLSVS